MLRTGVRRSRTGVVTAYINRLSELLFPSLLHPTSLDGFCAMLYDDIADTVIRQAHKLPEHLAPQPECVEHHCLRCVRRWGEKKADGFTCSWTEISLGCEREIRYAKCSHCKELGQKCLEVGFIC